MSYDLSWLRKPHLSLEGSKTMVQCFT